MSARARAASVLQLSATGLRLAASRAPRCRTLGSSTATSSSWPWSVSPVSCRRSYCSNVKVRSYLRYMKNKMIAPPTPPYPHVCQAGDPVLRSRAADVDPAAITGPEIQKVIGTMVKVMRKVECVGLSAPQVGVPLRIFALEYPERLLQESSSALREAHGLSVQPLRVFINPQLRVLDGRTVLFQEACKSIEGYSAVVPRYVSVEVSSLNEKGEAVTFQATGWPARILQHEMDHLDGVLYVDRMDSTTFVNIHWQEHNE